MGLPLRRRLKRVLTVPGADPRKRLTLLDVAKVLGVSRTTVSNAFNQPHRLSDKLRDPVLAQQVRAMRKPIVLVDSCLSGTPSVNDQNRHGAELAMAHALAAQPDRVLALSFPLNEAARAPVDACAAGAIRLHRRRAHRGLRGGGAQGRLRARTNPPDRGRRSPA